MLGDSAPDKPLFAICLQLTHKPHRSATHHHHTHTEHKSDSKGTNQIRERKI
jgi:hypothetical protein